MTRSNQPLYFLLLAIIGLSACSKRFTHTVRQVPQPAAHTSITPNYTDSTITVAAGTHYDRSGFHTFFYGKHYRAAWATPVEAPVLDIGTAHGGLTPIGLGGSRQTISLRLADSAGTEYVLRSLDKEPASALSEKLQQSYLADVVRDATSATNPYAALALPHMAKAIGIYHLEPKLVYVPHDPRLGKYKDEVGGMLALLERHPSDDQSDYAPMGNAEKVKSSRSAIEERLKDNDSYFDARAFLRARLFDMLIGDWSRHEDNWRWAELPYQDKAYTYKPIPRDRDNIFYKIDDGPLLWALQRFGVKSHFQTFKPQISAKQLEKLNTSGRNLDELILTQLQWQDWQEIADSVQQTLTDKVIDEAFTAMPEPITNLYASQLGSSLKSRRNGLLQMARNYYETLSREVQVVGTDKHERFDVKVLDNGDVHVQVYKIHKDGDVEQLIYDRLFHANETKQLELYGLNGEDRFILSGKASPKIKLKIWGGASEDSYRTEDDNLGKNLYIYDTLYRNTLDVASSTHVELDNDQKAQTFDAEGWLLRYYLD